jgi:hypothetical protein
MLDELTTAQPTKPARSFSRRVWIGMSAGCLLLAIVLALAYRWTSQVERVRVNFITEPFEATIQLDGVPLLKPDGTPYTTPCTVPDVAVGIHHVIFKRESLNDLDIGRIDFRQRRDIEVRWNLAPDQRTSTPVSR